MKLLNISMVRESATVEIKWAEAMEVCKEEFTHLFLHNCKIPCNFNLIHSSCHNYMMCVCLNIEAMQV